MATSRSRGVAAIHDDRGRAAVVDPGKQSRNHVQRTLGGGETDALEAAATLGHERIEPLETQRQVTPPLVAGQRVHLVDDDRAHVAQHCPRRRRGQEQVEGLGRGDKQVW